MATTKRNRKSATFCVTVLPEIKAEFDKDSAKLQMSRSEFARFLYRFWKENK